MTTGRRVAIVTGGSRGLGRACAIVVNDLHDRAAHRSTSPVFSHPARSGPPEVIALLAGI